MGSCLQDSQQGPFGVLLLSVEMVSVVYLHGTVLVGYNKKVRPSIYDHLSLA